MSYRAVSNAMRHIRNADTELHHAMLALEELNPNGIHYNTVDEVRNLLHQVLEVLDVMPKDPDMYRVEFGGDTPGFLETKDKALIEEFTAHLHYSGMDFKLFKGGTEIKLWAND